MGDRSFFFAHWWNPGSVYAGMGERTKEFEDEIAAILDVPHVVACSSGTAALYMSTLALGIGPGDEVIVPTRTFIATANAVYATGAKVVLVDCDWDGLIDIDQVRAKINSRTKAVIPVHLSGRPCNMGALQRLSILHNFRLVEDACQAFACRTPRGYLGTLGDLGVFSFGMTKLVACGNGGAVVTNSKRLADKLRLIRNNGCEVGQDGHYQHRSFGLNFKMGDNQAALGLECLDKLEQRIDHLEAIDTIYRELLSDVPRVRLAPKGIVPLYPEIMTAQRDELSDFLLNFGTFSYLMLPGFSRRTTEMEEAEQRGIGTRPLTLSCHTALHLAGGEFPISEKFDRHGLTLPGGPGQPFGYAERTGRAIRQFYSHEIAYEREIAAQ